MKSLLWMLPTSIFGFFGTLTILRRPPRDLGALSATWIAEHNARTDTEL